MRNIPVTTAASRARGQRKGKVDTYTQKKRKQRAAKAGALEAIVVGMCAFPSSLGIQEQGCAALRNFMDAEHMAGTLPGDWERKLTPFQRLLLIRVMRPDRVTAAMAGFVRTMMGARYIDQPTFNMKDTYEDSSAPTPLFFVLFPGVDPGGEIEKLGKELGFTEANGKYKSISMGQGQEKPAEAKLTEFAEKGGWILLQNCHLMQSWLPTFERKLELCSETANPSFRCFISAEPPPISYLKNLPEALLQSCIKVANEAPADLKSNLRRAWALFSQVCDITSSMV